MSQLFLFLVIGTLFGKHYKIHVVSPLFMLKDAMHVAKLQGYPKHLLFIINYSEQGIFCLFDCFFFFAFLFLLLRWLVLFFSFNLRRIMPQCCSRTNASLVIVYFSTSTQDKTNMYVRKTWPLFLSVPLYTTNAKLCIQVSFHEIIELYLY